MSGSSLFNTCSTGTGNSPINLYGDLNIAGTSAFETTGSVINAALLFTGSTPTIIIIAARELIVVLVILSMSMTYWYLVSNFNLKASATANYNCNLTVNGTLDASVPASHVYINISRRGYQ